MAQSYTPITFTGATLTIDRDSHVNTVVNLDRAAGMTVNLPAATGGGDVYRFVVKTTFTGSATIAALGTDVMAGVVSLSTDVAGVTCPTTATSDKLVMNGSTTGGLAGSYIECRDALSATWIVTGAILSTGAEATPFSAT
jgi:hypothetical protein